MGMPLKAKQEIQREAFFLEKVGYRKTEDANSISYAQNELVFLISFLPNSEESDIMIHFKKENGKNGPGVGTERSRYCAGKKNPRFFYERLFFQRGSGFVGGVFLRGAK